MAQGPWWKRGSGLRNENTIKEIKADCVLSKSIIFAKITKL